MVTICQYTPLTEKCHFHIPGLHSIHTVQITPNQNIGEGYPSQKNLFSGLYFSSNGALSLESPYDLPLILNVPGKLRSPGNHFYNTWKNTICTNYDDFWNTKWEYFFQWPIILPILV